MTPRTITSPGSRDGSWLPADHAAGVKLRCLPPLRAVLCAISLANRSTGNDRFPANVQKNAFSRDRQQRSVPRSFRYEIAVRCHGSGDSRASRQGKRRCHDGVILGLSLFSSVQLTEFQSNNRLDEQSAFLALTPIH